MKSLVHAALILLAAGCSTTPADVAGTYTIALTNRDNGCNFQNYTVGAQSTGIPVTITQSGASATADVMGAAGVALDVSLGAHVYTGAVEGDGVNLKLQGTRAQTSGNCTYTYDSDIVATLVGDALSGQIRYTAATNGHTDCTTLQSCLTYQDFNGTRAPR